MAFTFKPKQPPKADFSTLVKAVNEARAKVGLPAHVSNLPLWKRWVEGAGPEYDGAETGSIRDVLNADAYALDALKNDHDGLDDREQRHYTDLNARVGRLEAAPAIPFPASSLLGSSTTGLSRPRSLRTALRRLGIGGRRLS